MRPPGQCDTQLVPANLPELPTNPFIASYPVEAASVLFICKESKRSSHIHWQYCEERLRMFDHYCELDCSPQKSTSFTVTRL
jgi:hypothetical protein